MNTAAAIVRHNAPLLLLIGVVVAVAAAIQALAITQESIVVPTLLAAVYWIAIPLLVRCAVRRAMSAWIAVPLVFLLFAGWVFIATRLLGRANYSPSLLAFIGIFLAYRTLRLRD